MKLATYTPANGHSTMGALIPTPQGDRLLDLHAACQALSKGSDVAQTHQALGKDLFQFVRNADVSKTAARDLLEQTKISLERGAPLLNGALSDPEKVTFLPPITRPGKIIAIGANYPAHVQEIGDAQTDAAIADIGKKLSSGEYPPAFPKMQSSLAAHRQDIPYPRFTQQLDYEAELAFVIGRDCQDVPEERASEYIAGFMISNDVSARDVQFREMKRGLLLLGKNFDASAPMGPYFVTADEVGDFNQIDIRCWVNGQLRQSERTGRMIWSIPKVLAFYSKMPLFAGDIFLTGSPAGVAIGMANPDQYLLKPGDVIEIEMTGLGRLTNVVGAPA